MTRLPLLLTCLFALFLPGCSKAPQNTNEGNNHPTPLIVGMELAYPPFEMTDEYNQPKGISVEIAYALGENLGRPVRIENIPFAGLIPSLKTGKIDLIISSMTATEERARSIDFSKPYLQTGLCLLVGKYSAIKSIEDLNHSYHTIAVKQGTTGHLYANQHLKKPKILLLEKESAAVLEVVQGKADAFIYDQMSTYMNWQRNLDSTKALLNPIKQESWAIGIAKGNSELRNQVNTFLDIFKKQGGFEQLGNQYLPQQKAAFKQLNIPFYF